MPATFDGIEKFEVNMEALHPVRCWIEPGCKIGNELATFHEASLSFTFNENPDICRDMSRYSEMILDFRYADMLLGTMTTSSPVILCGVAMCRAPSNSSSDHQDYQQITTEIPTACHVFPSSEVVYETRARNTVFLNSFLSCKATHM